MNPEVKKQILILHQQGHNNAEIGRLFNLSRERIRQIVGNIRPPTGVPVGRKPYYSDGKMNRIHIVLPVGMQAQVLRSCVRKQLKFSAWIRAAIEEKLERDTSPVSSSSIDHQGG